MPSTKSHLLSKLFLLSQSQEIYAYTNDVQSKVLINQKEDLLESLTHHVFQTLKFFNQTQSVQDGLWKYRVDFDMGDDAAFGKFKKLNIDRCVRDEIGEVDPKKGGEDMATCLQAKFLTLESICEVHLLNNMYYYNIEILLSLIVDWL